MSFCFQFENSFVFANDFFCCFVLSLDDNGLHLIPGTLVSTLIMSNMLLRLHLECNLEEAGEGTSASKFSGICAVSTMKLTLVCVNLYKIVKRLVQRYDPKWATLLHFSILTKQLWNAVYIKVRNNKAIEFNTHLYIIMHYLSLFLRSVKNQYTKTMSYTNVI